MSGQSTPNVLSVAGSDPSGGAGVQMDIKAISASGGYAMAALTALTAQNTRAVLDVHTPPAAFVAAQINAVFADVRVDAVKIGMLANAEIADAVADALIAAKASNIVLDPVMVATSGDRLLAAEAVTVIVSRLVPLAAVVTPNLPEALAMLGAPARADGAWSRVDMATIAPDLLALGAGAVVLKGGHLAAEPDASPDLFAQGAARVWLEGRRTPGRALHGGGCALSAMVATELAKEGDALKAARAAKARLAAAVVGAEALEVGSGARPLDPFALDRSG